MLIIVARLIPLDPTFESVLRQLAADLDSGSWSFMVPICTVPKQIAIDVAVEELSELPGVREVIAKLQSEMIIGIDGQIQLDRHGRCRCPTRETGEHFSELTSAIHDGLDGVFESLVPDEEDGPEDTESFPPLVRHTMLTNQLMLVELEEYHLGERRIIGEILLQMSPQWFKLECIDFVEHSTPTQATA